MLSPTTTRPRLFGVTLCLLAAASIEGAVAAPTTPVPQAPQVPVPHALAPYAGPVNAAHYQAPPFQWGWFGAERVHPQVRWGRDYHGDLLRWSRHRRY